MSKLKTWHIGFMREDLMDLKKGDKVAIIKSTKKFTNSDLNPSYWVMHPKKGIIYQVTAYCYGENAHKLVGLGAEIYTASQDKMTEEAKKLLADSVYSPKGQKLVARFMDAVHQFRERIQHAAV